MTGRAFRRWRADVFAVRSSRPRTLPVGTSRHAGDAPARNRTLRAPARSIRARRPAHRRTAGQSMSAPSQGSPDPGVDRPPRTGCLELAGCAGQQCMRRQSMRRQKTSGSAMHITFPERRVLITGGARGIGAAIVHAFAAERAEGPCPAILTDRQSRRLRQPPLPRFVPMCSMSRDSQAVTAPRRRNRPGRQSRSTPPEACSVRHPVRSRVRQTMTGARSRPQTSTAHTSSPGRWRPG